MRKNTLEFRVNLSVYFHTFLFFKMSKINSFSVTKTENILLFKKWNEAKQMFDIFLTDRLS